MKSTRQLCFDPVRCVVTVDLGADRNVAVLTVNEAASHLVRHHQRVTTRYEAVHGSVLLLGPVGPGDWTRPAVVLIDLPDEQIRCAGTVVCARHPSGHTSLSLEVLQTDGEEFMLHLSCNRPREFPVMAGVTVDAMRARS